MALSHKNQNNQTMNTRLSQAMAICFYEKFVVRCRSGSGRALLLSHHEITSLKGLSPPSWWLELSLPGHSCKIFDPSLEKRATIYATLHWIENIDLCIIDNWNKCTYTKHKSTNHHDTHGRRLHITTNYMGYIYIDTYWAYALNIMV